MSIANGIVKIAFDPLYDYWVCSLWLSCDLQCRRVGIYISLKRRTSEYDLTIEV